MTDIAIALRQVLEAENLSPDQLATASGVDLATINQMLAGASAVDVRTVGAIFGAAGYVLDVRAVKESE